MNAKQMLAIAVAAALALSASSALAQGKPDKDSQNFIKNAIEGNIAEVNVGKLAQEKGKSQAVKDFGKMLETDHGKANDNAKAAASQIGVEPPNGSSVMEKATYLKLKVLSGDTFDRSFANSMVSDHKSDIKTYQKEASKSDAAGQYAKQTLPDLQKHLQMAQELQAQLEADHRQQIEAWNRNQGRPPESRGGRRIVAFPAGLQRIRATIYGQCLVAGLTGQSCCDANSRARFRPSPEQGRKLAHRALP